VQTDAINDTHPSLLVCPITRQIVDLPMIRMPLDPSEENGLKQRSEVMVDKVVAIHRSRVLRVIGNLENAEMRHVDVLLRSLLFLDH
jgi:mRNA interferase MazF